MFSCEDFPPLGVLDYVYRLCTPGKSAQSKAPRLHSQKIQLKNRAKYLTPAAHLELRAKGPLVTDIHTVQFREDNFCPSDFSSLWLQTFCSMAVVYLSFLIAKNNEIPKKKPSNSSFISRVLKLCSRLCDVKEHSC